MNLQRWLSLSRLFLFAEPLHHRGAELAGARQLRGAFSDTEEFVDHGLVSANRCSSRTSSISSWTENIKPSFTKKLKFQSVLEGEPVELKCKLIACPPPTILWFHNNRSVPKERRRRISTDSRMHVHTTCLLIDSVREKDSGSYKVMAINTEGSAESTASLLVSLREEQSANYLGFVRRSAKAHESVDSLAEERKERKFRVDLRCVGSPFDKMSQVHRGRSRSKNALVRAVVFRSGASFSSKEKDSEKESKRLETASERAPSPPPMFDRSGHFNDRLSDIYCDRRTGARFSDKLSDRCSDRYSDRFSDTESLHNEVRAKLTTLQKAVKQKKRLSVSTMSSSEFELESVTSESSYAEYVERLRVKPASLPDVQHFNRPFDQEDKRSGREPSQPRVRHLFEPQSRTRAIQIMKGELVDTVAFQGERRSGDKYSETLEDKNAAKSQADGRFEPKVREHHKTETGLSHKELLYSESTDSRKFAPEGESLLTEAVQHEVSETAKGSEESLRAQYEKSLEAERKVCEDKLLALRIRKWQQGSIMPEEEMFHPETEVSMLTEEQYLEPTEHIYTQKEMVEKRSPEESKTQPSTFQKPSTVKARTLDTGYLEPEEHVYTLQEDVKRRSADKRETIHPSLQKSSTTKARTLNPEAETPKSPKTQTGGEEGEKSTSTDGIKPTKKAEGSLRVQYEKSLEADRMECEEKLLALRIRKWQQGVQMSGEESFHSEKDLPADTKEHLYTQQEVVKKRSAEESGTIPSSFQKSSTAMKAGVLQTEYIESKERIYTQQEFMKRRSGEESETTLQSFQKTSDMKTRTLGTGLMESEEHLHTQQEIGNKRSAQEGETTLSSFQKPLGVKSRTLDTGLMETKEHIDTHQKVVKDRSAQDSEITLSFPSFQKPSTMKGRTLDTGYAEPEEHLYTQQEAVEKAGPVAQTPIQVSKLQKVETRAEQQEETTAHLPRIRMKAQTREQETLVQVESAQRPPRIQVGAKGVEVQSPKVKGRAERKLFERSKEEQELQLSRENLSELEGEKLVSEEEALTERIMKWQQDVLMEQQQSVESDWAEGYPQLQAETASKVGRNTTECSRDISPGKIPKEKLLLSNPVPAAFQDQAAEVPQWPPAEEMLTEGRETRLQTDSEYFVSEEEALAQRILKWQQDVVEPELEPEWALDNQLKQSGPGFEPHVLPFVDQVRHGPPADGALPSTKPSPHQQAEWIKQSTVQESSFIPASPPSGPTLPSYVAAPVAPVEASHPPDDLSGEAETRLNKEESALTVDKLSHRRFQTDVRDKRGIKTEIGTSRGSNDWRQQTGVSATERGEESKISREDAKTSAGSSKQQTIKKEEDKFKIPDSQGVKEDVSSSGSPPKFLKEISSLKVKVGELSEFLCQFQGDPLPTINWLKDGLPIADHPDYNITNKSNTSKLTLFYPTTDHEGTYDCIATNGHGESICSATLEISDKKVLRKTGFTQEVLVTEEPDKCEQNLESLIEEELHTYMGSGVATLQVPQTAIHKRRCSDESFTSSPVEIRITAATPLPEMLGEKSSKDQPPALPEKTSEVLSDEGAAQTFKHKFTFSFDVVGEAPRVVNELENAIASEGSTALMECVITGEPAPEVSWYFNGVCLDVTSGKYRAEVNDKSYRLYVSSFTSTDAGVYKCVAKNKLGEVTSMSHVSLDLGEPVQFSARVIESPVGLPEDFTKPAVSRTKDKPLISQAPSDVAVKAPRTRPGLPVEPPTLSGCGLLGSAAVIKVSQIKQAFESDSPASLTTPPPSEEQWKETQFPEEFIPPVAISFNLQEEIVRLSFEKKPEERSDELVSTRNPHFHEAPDPVVSEIPEPTGVDHVAVTGSCDAVKQFVEEVEESVDLVRPRPQKPAGLHKQIELGEVEMEKEQKDQMFDRTSSFIPFKSEKVSGKSLVRTSASAEYAEEPKRIFVPSKYQSAAEHGQLDRTGVTKTLTEAEPFIDEEVKGLEETSVLVEPEVVDKDMISVSEPSMDSGIFVSMPDTLVNVTEASKKITTREAAAAERKGKIDGIKVYGNPKPDLLTVKPTVAVLVGQEQEGDSLEGAAAAAVGSMEEEEVTFGAVYNYYNPPADWGRPLSPESEMSIEIGSTMSEEIPEPAERFYTPESSTEVSQPIAESLHTLKSPPAFQTPSSDSPGRFKTPEEFPFSSAEHKRPSTGDSNEKFFSPVQFLSSPADEGFKTDTSAVKLDENQFLNTGIGSLGLATLPEKVQGIPPAFLKPLIKKRVFENDTLTFYAEVFGLPSPEVRWFFNKTEVVADDRIRMERDGDNISLTIHSVTKADQGEYICEAVNYVGEARSVALVVVVSHEVRFMPAPPAVTHQHVMEFDVEENDSSRSPSPQEILLEVELDENEVKEFEKQVKIITIPEYTADNKSMVISLDVLPSIYEEGTVDFITQEHNDLKIAFEVTEMPPRFINPICDMETPEGTTVMFECSLMGIPSPIVSWFKGDKKIPHNTKKYLHSSDGDNHFLKICKVTLQESGVYTCRAINPVGETLCRASLVVLSAKAFSGKTRGRELTAVSLGSAKVQPQKFDLMVGNTSFDGEQVSEIELEFEFEQEVDESQRAVRLVANTDNQTSEQGEKYVSINFNVFAEPAKDEKIEFKGKSSEMCNFHFQVTEMPPKCVIPLNDVTTAVGTPVILQCLFNGKPNPTAEWFKDGEPITDGRCIIQEKSTGHFNMLITNVTQSDAGEYKCLIQNSAGSTETSALLKVF